MSMSEICSTFHTSPVAEDVQFVAKSQGVVIQRHDEPIEAVSGQVRERKIVYRGVARLLPAGPLPGLESTDGPACVDWLALILRRQRARREAESYDVSAGSCHLRPATEQRMNGQALGSGVRKARSTGDWGKSSAVLRL